MQFPNMQRIAREDNGIAFQTDSIEGWLKSEKKKDLTATLSSRHSDVLGRQAAVVMSISYGRTAETYEQHFRALILSLGYDTFEEFQQHFVGNIRSVPQK